MFNLVTASVKHSSLLIFCMVVLQVVPLAANVAEVQMFEEGSHVNLTCGSANLSSSTELSWSKDQIVFVNTTSSNSALILFNLTANDSGLYVCIANASITLRRVQLVIEIMEGTEPGEEEEIIPDEGLTKIDIIAIVVGLGLTTFLVVSIALLLYRAEARRREAKYQSRWKISVNEQVKTSVEEELVKIPPSRRAFYLSTGREPNRLPPRYKKPMNYRVDNRGMIYEVDGNANNDNNNDNNNNNSNNNDGILQWRYTAYL